SPRARRCASTGGRGPSGPSWCGRSRRGAWCPRPRSTPSDLDDGRPPLKRDPEWRYGRAMRFDRRRLLPMIVLLGSAALGSGCGDDDYAQDAAPVKDLAVQLDLGPRDLTPT